MSAHTRFMYPLAASTLPQSTSSVMAPIMARQFCRLQATGAGNTPPGEIPPSVTTQGISTPLRPMAWQQALLWPSTHTGSGWLRCWRACRMGLGLGSTPLRHADPPPGTTHLLTSILWWCWNTCGSRWQRAICWVHLARASAPCA